MSLVFYDSDVTPRAVCGQIVRVDAALSYRRYLVRYLGWLRRYREWVTDAVIRCPPAPLKHNSGGQILLVSSLTSAEGDVTRQGAVVMPVGDYMLVTRDS